MDAPTDPAPLHDLTAIDIAGTFSRLADMVEMHVVDSTTVLAIGFSKVTRATGRIAWIVASAGGWVAVLAGGATLLGGVSGQRRVALDTEADLDGLAGWLRGGA